MRLVLWLILKLCNPHAIRITISSNPNLWHLNRSLTIRHFFIPPMACSTLILIPEILLFSCFSSRVSSFPLGFFLFLGMHTSITLQSMSLETCILPESYSFRKWKRLYITYLLVVSMTFICRTQPNDSKITDTQQVVLYNMIFFFL